jgi:hypothetical protein
VSRPTARTETLWIFDADFEDLLGDNAGWTSYDRSGSTGYINYWHKDTIRMSGFPHLGDSTWWCGTYDDCWRQPRGYGNDWVCILSRNFPEVTVGSEPGDALQLEYDQRIAIEARYDYGYTDVSTDGGATWTTVTSVTNPGFPGTPGPGMSWNNTHPSCPGHEIIDLSEFAGEDLALRFRFESDGVYSSQDQWDNPPSSSCLDGAWQLDNIAWYINDELLWLDDCESPGDNGWARENIPTSGQTGVTFFRGVYGTDFWTGHAFSCDERQGWMYAAVDPATSTMVDYEYAWLMSPPIDISGATHLVGQWDMWIDFPRRSGDIFNLLVSATDLEECVVRPDAFFDESPGWWYGGPEWGTWTDDWDALTGNHWLAMMWAVQSEMVPPPEDDHMGGLFLNRQRVGILTGDLGTTWSYSVWYRFNDWFQEQMAEALLDSAVINVRDDDDIVSVTLVADNGVTQTSYACMHRDPQGNDWIVPPPATEMFPGAEVHYYFEAEDGIGITSVFPQDAPDVQYEFSILPIHGSVSDPSILLVDKHGRRTPGEQRDYAHATQDFYEEMLDVLGHEYDVYDVEVPSSSTDQSNGPDSVGYKYYDTQIWFTSDFSEFTIKLFDQQNLIAWLGQASGGKERNLLLTGNDIGQALGAGSLGFASTWLAADYCESSVGTTTSDTVPGLRDVAGGFDFMTSDDGECVLRGGCPELARFDVIQPHPGSDGTEVVAEYVKEDLTTRPAGVAYTCDGGHQAVTLGFGMEFMSDVLLPNGYFASGMADRVDLMENIMDYFGRTPAGSPTGVADSLLANRLRNPCPNPFNPATTIAYSLAGRSHVTIRVYDVAGRVVTTLVDGELEAGPHTIVWDGTTDSGDRAASGVYFMKMEASGDAGAFSETGKAVMLK